MLKDKIPHNDAVLNERARAEGLSDEQVRKREYDRKRQRLYVEEHREHVREYNQKYYKKNRKRIRAYQKAYYQAHKKRYAEYALAAYRRKKEKEGKADGQKSS